MRFLSGFLCLLCVFAASAQHAPESCAHGKVQLRRQQARQTAVSPAEDSYDIHHLFFDISLTNQSTTISGSVATRAVVVAESMAAYVFELSDELSVDSVTINRQRLPVTTAGSIRSVTLPAALPRGSGFTAQVFYHGTPESGYGPVGKGITSMPDDRWPVHVTYTLSEPYFASDWWPCKQALGDKIDSVDMWITVAPGLKAGSNGLLQRITPVSGGYMRYEWRSRHPVDYYLISATVAPYQEYTRYMRFDGSADSMLLQDYIYDDPEVLPLFKPALDSVALMIRYLSGVFGRYPFYREKYGHCLSPMWGGMEHQTMTTLRHFGFNVVVHELAHQWFGDYVTCASWKDIWLNEGFATYCEYLGLRHFQGDTIASAWLRSLYDKIRDDPSPGGSVYVNDTTDTYRIFDGRLTYNKGAAVLHTLRAVINDDSLFFHAIRTYLAQHAFGTAATADLQHACEQVTQQNLDSFFRQWIYGEGFPHIDLQWNYINGHAVLRLAQEGTVPAAVPFFTMPVEVQVISSERDTVIRLYSDRPVILQAFLWPEPVQEVRIDPHGWLLHTETVTRDTTLLSAELLPAPPPFVYPNPATDHWRVVLAPPGTEARVTDAAGRTVLRQQLATGTDDLPARQLATGIYLLELRTPGGERHYRKLWKR